MSDAEHEARLARNDADGDGFEDVALGGEDCDDSDPSVYPGAPETCADGDEDCDGAAPTEGEAVEGTIEIFVDADGDGYGDDAQGTRFVCEPPEDSAEVGGDCDDLSAAINPSADEICNTIDDDCDGDIDADDDDLVGGLQVWVDDDGDGFGDEATGPSTVCALKDGLVEVGGDCDDTSALVYPDAPESCPGFGEIQDCDATEACVVGAEELSTLLEGIRTDDLVAGGGALAIRRGVEIGMWSLPLDSELVAPLSWPASPYASGVADPNRLDLTCGGQGVYVGSPEEDGGRGVIHAFTDLDSTPVQRTIRTSIPPERIGAAIAWGGGALLGSKGRGGDHELAVADLERLRMDGIVGVSGEIVELRARRVSSGQVAALARQSGGTVTLFTGSSASGLAERAQLSIDGSTTLGRQGALLNIDGLAQADVLLADASSTLYGWTDPEGAAGPPTYTIPLPGPPAALSVGDLDRDGFEDVAVGLPGTDEVRVYLTAQLGTGEPARVRILGEPGSGLGSTLAFDDVDGDGIDDLILGARTDQVTYVLHGAPTW